MSDKQLVHEFTFNFSPNVNSGESLLFAVEYYKYKNGEIGTSQKIGLNSYYNSASFELCGIQLTPQILRELADRMEKEEEIVERKMLAGASS